MHEHILRAAFSFLAATVLLAMAQEHFTWAITRREPWWLLTGVVLTGFSLLEANKVWTRMERILF